MKLNPWPVVYTGIASMSIGSWINKGLDAGLIVAGLCLIIAGLLRYFIER
jgi:hypothetical protein